MAKLYMYVVDRDFGFAPNPFHGTCTLATCKAGIRARAQIGDWVIGMGGGRLEATGRCIFAMLITDNLCYDEYWSSPTYFDKRPVRNGSQRMMVGDNIYHHDGHSKRWHQADSHHSNPDGTPNISNIETDTTADRVLISSHFYYFGRNAPLVPTSLLDSIGFRNNRNYRVFNQLECAELLKWLDDGFGASINLVLSDPFDFGNSSKRYSAGDNKIR